MAIESDGQPCNKKSKQSGRMLLIRRHYWAKAGRGKPV